MTKLVVQVSRKRLDYLIHDKASIYYSLKEQVESHLMPYKKTRSRHKNDVLHLYKIKQ